MKTRSVHRLAAVLLGFAVLGVAACGSTKTETTTATTAPANASVTVDDPWARTSPMATTMGAAYMTLTASTDDALVSASVPSDVAGKVELHETVEKSAGTTTTMMGSTSTTPIGSDTTMAGSGEMEMRPVTSIALPAGEAVNLQPGGYHIMLLDLVAPLTAGQTFAITLSFEKAGEQTVQATVRDS